MKVKSLAVAAGVCAPLILAGSSNAGFVGIETASKPNEFGILTVNVYAVFDNPGQDFMQAVAGTPLAPMMIEVNGGIFYNHDPGGTDRPPQASLVAVFPSLAFDTFATIGVKAVDPAGIDGQPVDNMEFIPGTPLPIAGSIYQTTSGGWFVNLGEPQGDPFDPVNCFPGDGRVLIGQFSTEDGTGIQGTMLLQFTSNDVVEQQVVAFDTPCTPGVITVPGDFSTIQAAIDAACDGDEIVVAPGTYFETINFLGKAITLRSSDGPDMTTIDAQLAGSVVICTSGEGLDTVLEGFTITGGSAPGGGGMRNVSSSPTVINCTFSGNSATNGGGMRNWNGSATVTDCTFSGNSADEGGGMDNGGSSNPTVTDCTFSGNSATNGGGMFNGLSSPTVTNCAFSGSTATGRGGGMYNVGGSPTVTNCTFSGNNAVSFSGGGMHSQNDSSATITNCTFSGNSAPVGGGMYSSNVPSLTVANCILWGNQPDQIFDNGVGLTVIFSDVQGGFVGTGNIDIDPLFVDADGVDDIVGTDDDDLRLLAVSPALDAGTNTPPGGLPATDLDGNPRVLDGNFDGIVVVDMGAYELNPDTSPVVLNVTQGTLFDSLAAAIGDAVDGDELLASVGAFLAEPNIDLLGKSLTVRSSGAIDQAAGGLYVLADNSSLSTATGQDITLGGELRVRTGESADVVANQLIAGVTSELVARTNAGLFISTTGGTTIDGDATLLAGATMGFAGDVAIGGSMTAISNATASVTGSLSSTGTVSLLNGVTLLSGPLSSSGVMQMSAVTVLAEGFSNLPGGAVVVSGDIFSDITNDSQLTCIGDTLVVGDYTNNDTTIVQIGTLTIIGTLINDGTIIGDVVGGLAPGGGTQPGDGLDISGDFVAGAGSSLLMPDTVWSFGLSGNYDLAIDDNTRYHMAEAELHLAGVAQTLEIMSEDIGATSDGLDPTQPGHYPIGTLRIGPGTTVNMVDDHDNDGLGQIAPEAIYVETLVVDAGAVLNTNGTQVYYVSLTLDGTVDDPANLAQIVSTPPCPWDCATPADGQVSVVDFLALLAQWGQVGASCDFDDSGVSVTDFLALLANWGPCP